MKTTADGGLSLSLPVEDRPTELRRQVAGAAAKICEIYEKHKKVK